MFREYLEENLDIKAGLKHVINIGLDDDEPMGFDTYDGTSTRTIITQPSLESTHFHMYIDPCAYQIIISLEDNYKEIKFTHKKSVRPNYGHYPILIERNVVSFNKLRNNKEIRTYSPEIGTKKIGNDNYLGWYEGYTEDEFTMEVNMCAGFATVIPHELLLDFFRDYQYILSLIEKI